MSYTTAYVCEVLALKLYWVNKELLQVRDLIRQYRFSAPKPPQSLMRSVKLHSGLSFELRINFEEHPIMRAYLGREGEKRQLFSLPSDNLGDEKLMQIVASQDLDKYDLVVWVSAARELVFHPKSFARVLHNLDMLAAWLTKCHEGMLRHIEECRRQHEGSRAYRAIQNAHSEAEQIKTALSLKGELG